MVRVPNVGVARAGTLPAILGGGELPPQAMDASARKLSLAVNFP